MKNKRPVATDFTFDTVRPPYPGHPYFLGAESHPFRGHATVFDIVNAWWMIEASTLVYSDADFISNRFRKVKMKVQAFAKDHTECFVAHNAESAIVAFRGTESRGRGERLPNVDFSNVVEDVRTDAGIRLVESGQGGRVHEGFKKALDRVWDDLAVYLSKLTREGKALWFTGHSLGAALATLAADRFGDVAGLYTFGSPRVGDESFRSDFWVPTYRFLHNNDIVGRIPPSPYVHVGELKYIDYKGRIHENSWWWDRFADQIAGGVASFFNADGKLRLGFGNRLPDGIVDHVPALYATHIWNNLPD
jgi:hypothetical protein